MSERAEVVAIIPARGGSKRLPRKNIHPIAGHPMLWWSVEACRRSRHIDKCFVSTEDEAIAKVATECGAGVIPRPVDLSGDAVHKQDVIRQAVEHLEFQMSIFPKMVISLQANSPEIEAAQLDEAIDKFIAFDRWELFSVDENLLQNAAFRIMTRDMVFYRSLSVHTGAIICDIRDVHTLNDVRVIEASGVLQARLREWGL